MPETQSDYVLTSDLSMFTVNVKRAAETIGCSIDDVRTAISEGNLRAETVNGSQRIPFTALADHINYRTTVAALGH